MELAARTVILLDGALDYAGLFPPASLGMADAVRSYAAYRRGPHAALLGRFVVPAARLDELDAGVRALGTDAGALPWELSVIGGSDPEGDLERVAALQARSRGALTVASVERKVESFEEATSVVALYRGSGDAPPPWTLYLEVPTGAGAAELIGAVFGSVSCAKVRTGGVTPESFPTTAALADFVVSCARYGVAFKATAGLHHAIRGDHPVDGRPDSACATMHGFVNLFVGAALLHAGRIGAHELPLVLDERTRGAFQLEPGPAGAVRWRDRGIGPEAIRRARADLLHSFGTCSFDEPVVELQTMGALA